MTATRTILLRARKALYGELTGAHKSLFEGEGYDFEELREYQEGDDVRKIDWKISAKLDDLYVKVLREERELSVVAALLCGGSMHFGSVALKQETAALIAAIAGLSAVANGDRFGAFLFGERLVATVPPSKIPGAVARFVDTLLAYDPVGTTVDSTAAAASLASLLTRRSLVILVGDFFPGTACSQASVWRQLAKRHDLVLLRVRDPLEEEPRPFGIVDFRDPATLERIVMPFDPASSRRYRDMVRRHDSLFDDDIRRMGGRIATIRTTDAPYAILRDLFGHRR